MLRKQNSHQIIKHPIKVFEVFLPFIGLEVVLLFGVVGVLVFGPVLVRVCCFSSATSSVGLVLVPVVRLLPVFGLVEVELIGPVEVPVIGLVLVLRVFFLSTFGLILLQVIGVGGFGSLKS